MGAPTRDENGGRSQIVFSVLVASLTVVVAVYLFRRTVSRSKGSLPPGPPRYPLFGSLLSIGFAANLHEALHELSKKYGAVMLTYFGSKPTLVLSSPEMSEALYKTQDQKLASRPDVFSFDDAFATPILFTPPGPEWRYFRKLCMSEVVSPSRLQKFQALRQRELLKMFRAMLKTTEEGNVTIMRTFLSRLAFDSMALMIVGESLYSVSSSEAMYPEPTSLQAAVDVILQSTEGMNVAHYMSIFKPFVILGALTWEKRYQTRVDQIIETILAANSARSITAKEGPPTVPVSTLDILLSRFQNAGAEKYLTMKAIKAFVKEMIISGTDTLPTMVEWIFAELMKNPTVLRRAQEELDSVVGRERLVSESDVPHLKYIQAIVKEGLRLHPAGPLGAPREGTEDCEIAGYRVPSGTQVFVNVWSIQRDAKIWERPLEFDPDRFLSASRTVDFKGLNFEFLPFGGGRRICPAIHYSVLQMEYTLALLLHAADWDLPNGEEPEQMDMSEGSFSFFVGLKKAAPLGVIAKPRLPSHVIFPTNPM